MSGLDARDLIPLPREDGEAAFEEPWQAQTLAVAFALVERNLLTPAQWSDALGRELRRRAGRGEPDSRHTYYAAALSALEGLVNQGGHITATDLDRRTEQWRHAHLNTPHGKAVELEAGHPQRSEPGDQVLLVYDQECPACDTYCRLVRIAGPPGRLHLVNARDPSPVMQEITKAGLDIDQGMVVKKDGQLYYGSDAIHTLALLSSRSDLFNKLSHYMFRSRMLSHILYPGLRACRNLLLKVLGKTRINNLGIEGNDRF